MNSGKNLSVRLRAEKDGFSKGFDYGDYGNP